MCIRDSVVRLRPDTVAPGSRHLEDAGPSGTVRAMMVADALWVSRPKTPGASADLDNEADGPKVENRLAGLSLTTLSTVGRASGILKKANDPRVLQALKVVLDTKLVRPRLQLEKAAADGGHTLRFKTWSTTVIDTRMRDGVAEFKVLRSGSNEKDATWLAANKMVRDTVDARREAGMLDEPVNEPESCLLYTSPSPRD